MRYDAEVSSAIARWAPVYGVTIDPALVHAIIQKESSHGATTVTAESKGRRSFGPMMVLDSTARSLGASNPAALQDPATGISYGVKYLASLLRQYGGNVVRAVHAYNGWGGGPVTDTPNAYVNAVLGFWNTYKRNARVAVPATALLALGVVVYLLAAPRRRAA
jgi:soluble lytic murein transglycosylase-like protein